MQQTFDVSISRRGGFGSLQEAMAHRKVVGRLTELVEQSGSVAQQLRSADLVDVGQTGSELNKVLAPGQGHGIMGSTYKLEEGGVTSYFKHDANRGVLSIMDAGADVPRIFGDADPNKLTAGTIQLGQPLLIF